MLGQARGEGPAELLCWTWHSQNDYNLQSNNIWAGPEAGGLPALQTTRLTIYNLIFWADVYLFPWCFHWGSSCNFLIIKIVSQQSLPPCLYLRALYFETRIFFLSIFKDFLIVGTVPVVIIVKEMLNGAGVSIFNLISISLLYYWSGYILLHSVGCW